MTALKPADGQWEGVASVRYPLGTTCSHPECDRTDVTAHHIFPRGTIGNGSWFVFPKDKMPAHKETKIRGSEAIPHVVPLCGHGTDGHHGDVEAHRAWIKYEDGVFVWYDQNDNIDGALPDEEWYKVGALKPQPAEPAKKTSRKRFTGEARKTRKTISVKVPNTAEENGAEVWDTLVESVREKYAPEMGWDDNVPVYFVVTAALAAAIQ